MQATIQGKKIDYATAGTGLPLLLLHAFPLNQSMFDPQMAALSKASQVIVLNVPGIGRSEAGPVSMDGIADIAAALLEELKIPSAVVGGVSMGGYAAFSFARRYPERLLGLILADTRAAPDTPEARLARKTSVEFVLQNGSAAFAKQSLPKFVGETTARTNPEVLEVVRKMIEAAPPRVIAELLEALAGRRDSRDLLPSIKVPTLVLCGSEDTLTPAKEAREWSAKIPSAEFVEIDGAGHLANLEKPQTFNAAVLKFLAKLKTSVLR